MSLKYSFTICALLTGLLGCVAAHSAPRHTDFQVGMERAEILTRFGAPDSTRTITKDSEPIWGPIETFWSRVPNGAKVEIWSYKSHQRPGSPSNKSAGSTELYFVDDSVNVDGIGFAVEGAVYEGSSRR